MRAGSEKGSYIKHYFKGMLWLYSHNLENMAINHTFLFDNNDDGRYSCGPLFPPPAHLESSVIST